MAKLRISLDEADFRRLVAGQVVGKYPVAGKPTCEIALADIGFGAMQAAIDDAHDEQAHRRFVGPQE